VSGRGLVRAVRSAGPLHRLALALFAWITVGGPALHLVDHRDDHVHTATGVRRLPTARERLSALLATAHHHGDARFHVHTVHGDRSLATSPTRDARVDDGPGQAPSPLHGRGAAEHFGLAVLDAPAFVAPAPILDSSPLATISSPRDVVAAPERGAHPARGPPAASSVNARG
jgi:hypothetical protein